ncbi:hypothetical protein SAMN05216389_12635 [Oceanobacillus limi]|uniref:Uncharacterized protein n=1 Tax=Oceanobacillus limi TaxID=930131 RepID=A0A1I0H082_9BACI|nr:hypothetical protein [Oceanobacillus limi]SET76960.1 hypothetical protein SAMN05216389_12635 [Oceanobacillus limi]
MLQSYSREDVEKLLIQVKKYRKIIKDYQENDLSLDYYHLKAECKILKEKLDETRKRLSKIEVEHKDSLFAYKKLVEERNQLQQKINQLEDDLTKRDKTAKKQNEQSSQSSEIELKKLEQLFIGFHNELVDVSKPDEKENKDEAPFFHLEKCKNLTKDLLQTLTILENGIKSLNGKEPYENKMDEQERKESEHESLNKVRGGRDEIEKNMIHLTEKSIKGAESIQSNDQENTVNNETKTEPAHELGSTTSDSTDHLQLNTAISNLQSEISDIKKILEENKKEKNVSTSKSKPYNFLEQARANREIPRNNNKKEITFRDLQGASTMSPVLGSKLKKKEIQNQKPFFQQANKRTYVRHKDGKNNPITQPTENKKVTNTKAESSGKENYQSTNEVGNKELQETNSLNSTMTNHPIEKEAERKTNHVNTTKQDNQAKENRPSEEQQAFVNDVDNNEEKKSKLRSLWDKITKY